MNIFNIGNSLKSRKRTSNRNLERYNCCIKDLIGNESVKSMSNFIQHNDVTCLDHCISVSYYSYLVCRFFKRDWRSAARGGLLHDLFLYDWHHTPPRTGLHAFVHPSIALKNAEIFNLNNTEKDIIKKHMWPLTVIPPYHFESLVVSCVDKYCALCETSGIISVSLPGFSRQKS
ncbi:MAG TPA: HD family phosphohydrolase [Ruminiclostridium sp.]|nr:HD family phosphohydrolase [Ruminiclostridium sp.]